LLPVGDAAAENDDRQSDTGRAPSRRRSFGGREAPPELPFNSDLPPLQAAQSREVELSDRTNTGPRSRGAFNRSPGRDKENESGYETPPSQRLRARRSSHLTASVDGSIPDSPEKGTPDRRRMRASRFRDQDRTSETDSHGTSAMNLPAATAGGRKTVGGTGHVYFVGSIVGATGFPSRTTFAKWTIEVAEEWGWQHQEGFLKGTTQPSGPSEDEDELSVWEHPVDLHLKTNTLQRWPHIVLRVYHRSKYMQRDEFYGYAVCCLPTTPGLHEFSCRVWRPNDERKAQTDEYAGYWTGLYPQCTNDGAKELIQRPGWEYSSILTCGMGEVMIRLFVAFKGMQDVQPQVEGARRNRAHFEDMGLRRNLSFQGDQYTESTDPMSPAKSRRAMMSYQSSEVSDSDSPLKARRQAPGRLGRMRRSVDGGGRHSRQSSLGDFGGMDADRSEDGTSPSGRRRHRRTGSQGRVGSPGPSSEAGGGGRQRHRRTGSMGGQSDILGDSRDSLPDIGGTRLRERYSRRSVRASRETSPGPE